MRRTQSAITFFNTNGIAHTVVQTKSAPGAAHAAFYRAQRFTIGMTTFKTGGYQFRPYERQIVNMRTKQIDALAAGYFRIEVVFPGYLSNYNQFFRGDLTTWYAGHY